MSTWTEVTGIIVCDWHSFSYPDKEQVKRDILNRRTKVFNILRKNLPEGSQGPINFNMKNYNCIIITGSLRDFNSIDIQEKYIVEDYDIADIPVVEDISEDNSGIDFDY